mmetsp:Transcript_1898/g.4848  ORF Transcript_1898/g.4848 Transcript_1898/m.4848 type:complete len:206 (+) Transcript_1898:123-740(+)
MMLSDPPQIRSRLWLLRWRHSMICTVRSKYLLKVACQQFRWHAKRLMMQTQQATLESCERAYHTGKDPASRRTVGCTQASGWMDKHTVWEPSLTRTGILTVGNGLQTKLMAMVCIQDAQAQPILVNGRRTSTMGPALSAGVMAAGTVVSSWKDIFLDMESSFGRMGPATRELCLTMRWIMGSTSGLMAKSTLVNGRLPDCMVMAS